MQAVLAVTGLPEAALDASARFHQEWLGKARAALAGEVQALALVFPPAPVDHESWRRAAVADLAREATPRRVNAVVGDDEAAIAHTVAWLAQAEGITGQFLPVVSGATGN